jgi:hypothetical protein
MPLRAAELPLNAAANFNIIKLVACAKSLAVRDKMEINILRLP